MIIELTLEELYLIKVALRDLRKRTSDEGHLTRLNEVQKLELKIVEEQEK